MPRRLPTNIFCEMKTKDKNFLMPSPSRAFTKNGALLLVITCLFATTFVLLSSDSSWSQYAGTRTEALLSATERGRQVASTNASRPAVFNSSCPIKRIRHGCYMITQGTTPKISLLAEPELRRLNCTKREPSAIIIGTKKSGTTTLKSFLSFHPDIAFAERELQFLNNNQMEDLDDYRAVMPYSTPYQVPMEKTPGYFIRLITAKRLQRLMPRTKFIVIVRDPVKRAVSDYVHMRYVDCRKKGGAKLIRKGVTKNLIPRYEVLDSFADSVMFPNGSVREYNSLLDSGLYAKYFRQWLQYFPRDQFLVLDGEAFVRNPAPAMSEVESFLGVRRFFTDDHFYFDEAKRFFCLKKPLNTCMKDGKGRPHPEIDEQVISRLGDYFKPHNKEFEALVNRTFPWS